RERRAAVAAEVAERVRRAAAVAPDDDLLAEELGAIGRRADGGRVRHAVPAGAQALHAGSEGGSFESRHGVSPAECPEYSGATRQVNAAGEVRSRRRDPVVPG